MRSNRKTIQLILISLGVLLILITYILYPEIVKNKIGKNETLKKKETIQLGDKKINVFDNVEYKGYYDLINPFTVKSKKAHIDEEMPDVVHMLNMKVTLHMKDGRIITISSDKGRYNKVSYDCFFEENVVATDQETTITSEKLDLFASNDSAKVYHNVVLVNDKGSLNADQIEYNLETRYYKISMFDDTRVKIKIN